MQLAVFEMMPRVIFSASVERPAMAKTCACRDNETNELKDNPPCVFSGSDVDHYERSLETHLR